MTTVDLHYYSLRDAGDLPARDILESALDGEEYTRYQRLKRQESKHTFVLARYWLKTALADKLGSSLHDVRFSYTENGKPYLPDSKIKFNLSHCATAVAFALGETELGVDVEQIERRGEPWNRVADYIHPGLENITHGAASEREKALVFSRYWTAMEAYTKLKAGRIFEEKTRFCRDGERFNAEVLALTEGIFIHTFSCFGEDICAVASEVEVLRFNLIDNARRFHRAKAD